MRDYVCLRFDGALQQRTAHFAHCGCIDCIAHAEKIVKSVQERVCIYLFAGNTYCFSPYCGHLISIIRHHRRANILRSTVLSAGVLKYIGYWVTQFSKEFYIHGCFVLMYIRVYEMRASNIYNLN